MSGDEQMLNPVYGSGRFRRRILLQATDGHVTAALEDDCHGFRLTLRHDDRQVQAVDGETLRFPLSTCDGAPTALAALAGQALDAEPTVVNAAVNPATQCTHLYDLALLAMAHARRGGTRQYDVVVEDSPEGAQPLTVHCDGQLVHQWQADGMQIAAPASLAGLPLMRGFAAWANERLHGDAREAAFVLHKGFFVSSARRYNLDNVPHVPADGKKMPRAVCYSYSEPRIRGAVRNPRSQRDFSESPEHLLRFIG